MSSRSALHIDAEFLSTLASNMAKTASEIPDDDVRMAEVRVCIKNLCSIADQLVWCTHRAANTRNPSGLVSRTERYYDIQKAFAAARAVLHQP